MAGGLLTAARNDAQKYVSEGGFESDITLITPDRITEFQTKGFASKHHISFDTDGTPINAKNAHICLSEALLIAGSYPVRISNEVKLINHFVKVADSSGVEKQYVVKEHYPDETLGLIVCILGDYDGECDN